MKRKQKNTDIITKYVLSENNIEKEMIEKLIQDDEKSRREFDSYVELWEKSANLKDYESIHTDEDWKKVKGRLDFESTDKAFPLLYYIVRVAAVLIVALGLFWIYNSFLRNDIDAQINYIETISMNEVKTIEMPDGSIIHLNRSSKIIYPDNFGTNNRDVILEGEAFFEVSRNENLPFRVHTLNSVVEVLGTSFDIKADLGIVVVGVLTGKVALYENKNVKNRVDLPAHNTGYFNTSSNKIITENSFDANRIAWHSKEFVFRNIPLQQVCNILADYYNLEIIASPDIQFIDSVNLNCSAQSVDEVLSYINSFLLENIELVASDNKLIVRKQ